MGRLTKYYNGIAVINGMKFTEAAKKLAHYEDLEEQGKLYILPCLPCEPVYISPKVKYYEGIVPAHVIYRDFYGIIRDIQGGYIFGYTEEEVIAKLKELKGDKE